MHFASECPYQHLNLHLLFTFVAGHFKTIILTCTVNNLATSVWPHRSVLFEKPSCTFHYFSYSLKQIQRSEILALPCSMKLAVNVHVWQISTCGSRRLFNSYFKIDFICSVWTNRGHARMLGKVRVLCFVFLVMLLSSRSSFCAILGGREECFFLPFVLLT